MGVLCKGQRAQNGLHRGGDWQSVMSGGETCRTRGEGYDGIGRTFLHGVSNHLPQEVRVGGEKKQKRFLCWNGGGLGQ